MKTMRLRTLLGIGMSTMMLASVSPVHATPIPINNPGFEANVLSDGGFISNTASGWTLPPAGVAGTFNPTTSQFPSEASEGQNTLYAVDGIIVQFLSTPLVADVFYELQVDVGNRLDSDYPGYEIQLWAGSTLLGSDTTQTSLPGEFATASVLFASTASTPDLGSSLQIRLLHGTGVGQVNFDNVRLSVDAVVPVDAKSWGSLKAAF